MPEQAARPQYQRARREAEKAERRTAILEAARTLLPATGFEAFTMAALARASGIAKGTIYLYFDTREEVLLALYVATLEGWSRALLAGLPGRVADAAFVGRFQDAAVADPNFLTLQARLESVIEHNVSRERLIEAKRAMRRMLEDLAPRVERALALPAGSGAKLLVALGALQLGAAQARLGPAVTALDLPEDVAEFMRLHTGLDPFRETAPMIIEGVRAGG